MEGVDKEEEEMEKVKEKRETEAMKRRRENW